MKPEQQRAILEAAAKACGIEILAHADGRSPVIREGNGKRVWNPLTNPADLAYAEGYRLGADSRKHEVAELRTQINALRCAIKDAADHIEELEGANMLNRNALRLQKEKCDALQADNAKLVAALKPFGAIDLVESQLPAEFAMLILRACAAIAKVRKP